MLGIFEEIVHSRLLYDLPGIHNGHPICDSGNYCQVMSN
jgi:hypothetical protein